jgi:hypothetical protein
MAIFVIGIVLICLCVDDGQLVFSAGTSTEKCARPRGSALLMMVFHGYVFSGFLFRRSPIELGLPMKYRRRTKYIPSPQHQIAFACRTLLNHESFGEQCWTDRPRSDGSLDLYNQNENPGADKEANWLPAPKALFNLTMRM